MEKKIGAAPTLVYPESDGEPMAETPKHQQVMIDCMDVLRRHFREFPDVFIAGNMFLYYEEGNPRKSISPDVFMARGVSQKELRVYKTWEQPPTLDFVLEVASPSTFDNDFTVKKEIYAKILCVKEYCIYDPYHEISPSFIGFRLVGGSYQEIEFVEGRLPLEVLGLELGEYEETLRLYDPITATWLSTSSERADAAESRTEQEILARQEAESRAEQEILARQREFLARQEAESRAEQEFLARQEADSRAEREFLARQEVEAELEKALAALKRLQAPE